MPVLLESGHQTTYPLNHARIMWNNVITDATATGARANYPAAAALSKTTYERWSPAVSGDSITLTFPEQYINCVTLAAHSNLNPTVEVRVFGAWETVTAYPPGEGPSLDLGFADEDYGVFEYSPDNEAIMFLIERRLADAVRITVDYDGAAPTLGVVMAGTVLEMYRPFYGGHNPAMLSTDSKVQPNVSESGEWLGASLLRQGRNVQMSWNNLPAAWVRKYWQPFSVGLKTNPFVVAWNPLGASSDAIYCSSSDTPQPSNSGTRNLQSVSLTARGYSDGTDSVVEPLVSKPLQDILTFTRASEATYYDAQGVLRTAAIDEPRLTHDPVTGESLGLLIEEQRSNLLLWSEAFDNAVWDKIEATVSANVAPAPDGTNNADKLVESTSSTAHYIRQTEPLTAGVDYSMTVYASKADERMLEVLAVDGTRGAIFDLGAGSVVVSAKGAAKIAEVGGGIYRCEFVFTAPANATELLDLRVNNTGALNTGYTGDGTSGIFIWGAQLEAGSFPTSYIATTSSQVTRSSDNASVDTLTPWFNAVAGTFIIKDAELKGDSPYYISVSDGTNSNRIEILRSNGFLRVIALSSSDTTDFVSNIPLPTGLNSVGISFSKEKVILYANGQSEETSSAFVNNYTPNVLFISRSAQGGSPGVATVKQIKYAPRALSAEELEALTAPEAN